MKCFVISGATKYASEPKMHNSLKAELDKATKGDIAYGVGKIPEKQSKLNTKMGWNKNRRDAFRRARICFVFRIVYVSR